MHKFYCIAAPFRPVKEISTELFEDASFLHIYFTRWTRVHNYIFIQIIACRMHSAMGQKVSLLSNLLVLIQQPYAQQLLVGMLSVVGLYIPGFVTSV